MAKKPIGEPIPLGEMSSLQADPMAKAGLEASAAAAIDALRSDNLPADNPSVPADEASGALPTADPVDSSGWFGLVRMSWQVALMPAVTWTSLLSASWKAWENSLQPQWLNR